MIILDTDVLSLMEWQAGPASHLLRKKFAQFPPEEIGTTIVNFEEQMRGWMEAIARKKKVAEQIEAYRRLHRQLVLYEDLTVLDFDETAAIEFQSLRKQLRRLGTADLKIASIALAHRAVVVTRNLRDFQQVPGLTVEDWTK